MVSSPAELFAGLAVLLGLFLLCALFLRGLEKL